MRERYLFYATVVALIFIVLVGFAAAKLTADQEIEVRALRREQQDQAKRNQQQDTINQQVLEILERITRRLDSTKEP